MGLCDTAVTQGGFYIDSPKKELLYFNDLVCGRGEIGKHKGLKSSNITGLVTRVAPNLFNQFNYLLDIISVAPLVKGRSDVSVS